MPTCRQVITTALRKLGAASEGNPAPVAYDADVALEVLQGWYDTAMASGVFGRLNDVDITADYTAQEFDRINNLSEDPVTITFPTTVTDCTTGETRLPLDLCPVVAVSPGEEPANWLYDALDGDWVLLTGLTLDSAAPLSTRGRDGLACILAMALTEERGGTVGPVTAARAGYFLSSITTRGSSQRRSVDYSFM